MADNDQPEVLEPETVDDSEGARVLAPVTVSFGKIYDIPEDELQKVVDTIYAKDDGILELSDMESVKVYARSYIILARLDKIINGPMFQFNQSGAMIPHPIHSIHERERKFFERMSMRLGQNPIARKAVLGPKEFQRRIEAKTNSGEKKPENPNQYLEDIGQKMFQ